MYIYTLVKSSIFTLCFAKLLLKLDIVKNQMNFPKPSHNDMVIILSSLCAVKCVIILQFYYVG